MRSVFGKINLLDLGKTIIVMFLGTVVTSVYGTIQSGSFPLDLNSWSHILEDSAQVSVGYLLKNWFSNSKGQFLKREIVK